MSVKAHPFLLLKRSTARLLSERAEQALARWSAAWAISADSALACVAASDGTPGLAASADWRHRTCDNGASAWVCAQAGLERHVEQMLFKLNDMDATGEKHVSSPIATSIAEEALQELSANLVSEMTGHVSQPAAQAAQSVPARLFRPGSGAVMCTVSLGEKSIALLLPPELVPSQAAPHKQSPRSPLATLRHALAKMPVRLSVEVGRTELTLGYLRTLAVGDVLALPTSVDHTMRVTGPGDTTVCHAHLGSLAGHHAVELIKPAH